MKNGWTGGQYSLFRIVFAVYLLMHFLGILDRGEAEPMVVRIGGVVLCLFFGIGWYDRAAALGLMGMGLYLFGLDVFVVCLLLAHVLTPPAPYGSWSARGRVDPGGGWRMPPSLFATAWIVLALSYTYDGYRKLGSFSSSEGNVLFWIVLAVELAFAPLALLSRLRPWLWTTMLIMQLTLLTRLDFALWNLGMLMYHLFAFDPGWIRPLACGTERLFYDGHCGLCQRSVRLILAEDATGTAFRFAPLQGETFESLLTASEREALPMSLVVRTEKGMLLTRSSGVLHILRRLGGVWRLLAGMLALLPPAVRDGLYDGVARIRHRIFARPTETCPLMPSAVRARFDP